MKRAIKQLLEFIEESKGFYHPITQRIYKKAQSLEQSEILINYYFYVAGRENSIKIKKPLTKRTKNKK